MVTRPHARSWLCPLLPFCTMAVDLLLCCCEVHFLVWFVWTKLFLFLFIPALRLGQTKKTSVFVQVLHTRKNAYGPTYESLGTGRPVRSLLMFRSRINAGKRAEKRRAFFQRENMAPPGVQRVAGEGGGGVLWGNLWGVGSARGDLPYYYPSPQPRAGVSICGNPIAVTRHAAQVKRSTFTYIHRTASKTTAFPSRMAQLCPWAFFMLLMDGVGGGSSGIYALLLK